LQRADLLIMGCRALAGSGIDSQYQFASD